MRAINNSMRNLLTAAFMEGLCVNVRTGKAHHSVTEWTDAQLWNLTRTTSRTQDGETINALPQHDRTTLLTAMRKAYLAGRAARSAGAAGYNKLTQEIPGTVWVLYRTEKCYSHSEATTWADLYADPRTAIADLADHARRHWAELLANPKHNNEGGMMPENAPADDFAAVALYYWNPLPADVIGHDKFELDRQAINPIRHRDGMDDRVLPGAYAEVECACGNTASSAGFDYAEKDGRITGGAGSCEYLVCFDCRRHFNVETSQVIGYISQADITAAMEALYG